MIVAQSIEPKAVFFERSDGRLAPGERVAHGFAFEGVEVRLCDSAAGVSVRVYRPDGPLSRVVIRWARPFAADALFLGDHWERSYGDLQWRYLQPERIFPWYFTARDEGSGGAFFAGVRTQPSAFCFWTTDSEGFSLWLDFRNGGMPSLPGAREILAATIVLASSDPTVPAWDALRQFCRKLCSAPRLPAAPVCGNNNWYYAYGKDFSSASILGDAQLLSELAGGHPNRPYCVVDAGWTPGGECPGGPWERGDPATFPDMVSLAAQMRARGVKPGIWIRPTAHS